MGQVIIIPKEVAEKGELVLIPKSEYEGFLKLRKQIEREEKDTDKAIRIFQKEKIQGKLIKIKSLSELD